MLTVKVLGDYINGQFLRPRRPNHKIISVDPGDAGYRIGSFPVYDEHPNMALLAARNAFDDWAQRDLSQRVDLLRKFSAEVVNLREEFRDLISAETGKPLWEAEMDINNLQAQVDNQIHEGVRSVKPYKIGEVRWGVSGRCRYRALGVVAVLGPAASPVDTSCAHIIPALLAGNSVVYKPSKLVPAIGQFIARLFDQIDLPPGVFNLIQGEAEVGLRLVEDSHVDAVLFAGAVPAGRRILQAAANHPHKLVALQMGGVNPMLVLDDADLDRSVYECVKGSYLTAGQRYTSTGVILVAKPNLEEFVERLVATISAIKVGYAFDKDVFMGPLLSQGALERALDRQRQINRMGATEIISATKLSLGKPGYYLSPGLFGFAEPRAIDEVRPEGQSFGPDLILMPFDQDSQALELANSTSYRLSSSVMTENRERFDTICGKLRFGQINHNLATTEISMRLPLTGMGTTGNYRPQGVFAQRNCTFPEASLWSHEPYDSNRNLPNFPKS